MKRYVGRLAMAFAVVAASSAAHAATDYTYQAIVAPGAISTQARGINNAGQIVGVYFDGNSGIGFLDDGGVFTSISVPGSNYTAAYDINNTGQTVGVYGDASGDYGYILTGGVFTKISVPGAYSTVAYGINDVGQVVGVYNHLGGDNHAFLYSNGTITTFDVPGAEMTVAYGINNAGVIVGGYRGEGNLLGFTDTGGVFTTVEPGTGNGLLTGINNLGQLAGQSSSGAFGNGSGFVDTDGSFSIVHYPGSYEMNSGDINDAGVLVGSYVNYDYFENPLHPNYGFVATPVTVVPPPPAVPEPATWAMFLIGFGAIGFAMRRNGPKIIRGAI